VTAILLDLVVADAAAPHATAGWPQPTALADAVRITEAACAAGVSGIRVLDHAPGVTAADAATIAAYLGAVSGGLDVLVDTSTTGNAPYNLARRVSSLHRSIGGRAGVVLHTGDGDAVSDAVAPDPHARHRGARWAEYALVLDRLWAGFPVEALVGDQEGEVAVDDRLIRATDHDGTFYRVAGPLDGPTERPLLAAADVDTIGWDVAGASADVVVLDDHQVVGADTRLRDALVGTGRTREDVRLFGRATAAAIVRPRELFDWAADHRLDGVDLVVSGGLADTLAVLTGLSRLDRIPEYR
jgi:alkanesulfonate monooxygenase SsuD/methylene tetrahydromethanopterin reductase-like flavin-dependent oxidoreductase (luciferase family)